MDHFETSVRERAYALWERDGRAHGRDQHHWLLAERELHGAEAAPAPETTPPARAKAPAAAKVAQAKVAQVKAAPKTPKAKAEAAPRRRRAAAEASVTTH